MNQPAPPHLQEQYAPRLREGTILRDLGDEALVWGPDAPNPIYLDPIKAVLLRTLDGVASTAEIVDDICDVVGIERGLASNHMNLFLLALSGGGALDFPGAEEVEWTLPRSLLPAPNW